MAYFELDGLDHTAAIECVLWLGQKFPIDVTFWSMGNLFMDFYQKSVPKQIYAHLKQKYTYWCSYMHFGCFYPSFCEQHCHGIITLTPLYSSKLLFGKVLYLLPSPLKQKSLKSDPRKSTMIINDDWIGRIECRR